MRRARYLADAGMFLGIRRVVRALPLDTASAVGGYLGRRLCPSLVDMKTIDANIATGMPSMAPAQRRRLAVDHLECFARTLAEIMQAESFMRAPERIEVAGEEHLERAIASGRGVVYASAHYGNPDIARIAIGQRTETPALLYRQPNNPYIRAAAAQITGAVGGDLYTREDDLRGMIRHLRNGGGLSLLVDQRPYKGARLPFLDQPALTNLGPASLAMRTGAMMVPTRTRRISTRPVRYRVGFEAPVEGDSPEALMAEMNRRVSGWIREAPEQWLWMHRRWR